ncbi:hypothetical protein ACO0LF_18435 [Undibacterium sp. Di27W]
MKHLKIPALRALNILLTGIFVMFGLPALALSIYIAVTPIDGLFAQMQTSRAYVRAFQEIRGRLHLVMYVCK